MYWLYVLKNHTLWVDNAEFPADALQANEVGVCSKCEGTLTSVSYHPFFDRTMVVARCNKCETLYIEYYDSEWNWLEEIVLSQLENTGLAAKNIVRNFKELEEISMEKLRAVFTKSEVDAIYSKATEEERPVRQYLYRARKKYARFEELFNIRIEF